MNLPSRLSLRLVHALVIFVGLVTLYLLANFYGTSVESYWLEQRAEEARQECIFMKGVDVSRQLTSGTDGSARKRQGVQNEKRPATPAARWSTRTIRSTWRRAPSMATP